jgi:hypothetical protein
MPLVAGHPYRNVVPGQTSGAATGAAPLGITISGTNTAANMTGGAIGISGFSGVDDGFGSFSMSTAMTLFGTTYGTGYLGTNGYITFASGTGGIFSNPTASTPNGTPALQIRPYDARGINASYTNGTSTLTTTANYVRVVASYYPYYGTNTGYIGMEIFFIRDATNAKQYIWLKIDTTYNLNGNPQTIWALTSGSAYATPTTFPGAGGSVVYASDLTGSTWTTTMPGSLVNF